MKKRSIKNMSGNQKTFRNKKVIKEDRKKKTGKNEK